MKNKDGGLKAPDFTAIDKALKLIWIKRFLDESDAEWKLIPMETFDRYGGKLLLQSRYSIKLLSLDSLLSFYTKMLQFWREIRNNERTTIDTTNIVKEVIWNNRCIQINQKTVFFEKWYSKGILKIGDVIDEDDNFLSFESFEKKIRHRHKFCKLLRNNKCNPRQWKQALKQTRNKTCNQSKLWYEDPSSFTTQKIYRHIIKFKFAAPSSQNLLIQRGIATEDLNSIYLLPYQSTTKTKLIAFQIKILHNILPTNATL